VDSIPSKGILVTIPNKPKNSRLPLPEGDNSLFAKYDHRGPIVPASLSKVHLVKSMGFLQAAQRCSRLNSSEKISFSLPQFGHLHTKDFKFLRSCMPGQCMGVVMAYLLFYGLVSVRSFVFYLNNSLTSRVFPGGATGTLFDVNLSPKENHRISTN
jgi:hypothetical protein